MTSTPWNENSRGLGVLNKSAFRGGGGGGMDIFQDHTFVNHNTLFETRWNLLVY